MGDPHTHTTLVYDAMPDPRSFRILRLEPGVEDAPINCALLTRNIDDPDVGYEAISYAWGDQGLRESITCNGQHLSITRSLYEAFEIFRLQDEPRMLWADAICINQNDLEERSHQVELMRSIYKSASEVLIWLGHESPETVCRGMQQVCDLINAKVAPHGIVVEYQWVGSTCAPSKTKSLTPADMTKDLSPMRKLLDAPWFTRLWVIQEVALSSSARLFWGNAAIDFYWIGSLVYYIRQKPDIAIQLKLNGRGSCCAIHSVALMFGLWTGRSHGLRFYDLLIATMPFSVTDPRDKVFGILGIRTVDCDPETGEQFLEPDYTLPVSGLWKAVAEKLILQQGVLDALSYVNHEDPNTKDLPSWVPSLHLDKGTVLGYGNNFPSESVLAHGDTRPSGGIHPTISSVDESRSCISIRGFQFDTIDMLVGGVIAQVARHIVSRKPEFLISLVASLKMKYDIETLACTLTGGLSRTHGIIYEPDAHVKLMHGYCNLYEKQASLVQGGEAFEATIAPDEKAYVSIFNHVTKRRYFFTTKGGLLGLGPDTALTGDVLCVLFGASVPFLLRPVGDRYRLVEECYVHEVATGRIVEEWKASGRPATDFHIT